MKKLIFLLIATFLMGCKIYHNQSVHKITEQVYVGMHVSEFLQIADRRYQKDAMNEEVFVYRVNQYGLNGPLIDSMFYYFDAKTERLIKVDAGPRWN